MYQFISRWTDIILEWLYKLITSQTEPFWGDIGGMTIEARKGSHGASGANLEPATAPMQMKRCAQCGELSRLYKVDGRAVCAKCAKGGSK